jgi:hypothetical protein
VRNSERKSSDSKTNVEHKISNMPESHCIAPIWPVKMEKVHALRKEMRSSTPILILFS